MNKNYSTKTITLPRNSTHEEMEDAIAFAMENEWTISIPAAEDHEENNEDPM